MEKIRHRHSYLHLFIKLCVHFEVTRKSAYVDGLKTFSPRCTNNRSLSIIIAVKLSVHGKSATRLGEIGPVSRTANQVHSKKIAI